MIRKNIHAAFRIHTLIILSVLLVVLAISYTTAIVVDASESDVIFDGVKIGSIEVGGLTREQAYAKVQNSISKIESRGIEFNFGKLKYILTPQTGVSLDVAPALWNSNIAPSIDTAFDIGRKGNMLTRVIRQRIVAKKGVIIPIQVEMDRERVKQTLRSYFDLQLSKPKETSFKTIIDGDAYHVEIVSGESGEVLMYDAAIEHAVGRLRMIDSRSILIASKITNPTISNEDAESLLAAYSQLLSSPEIIIKFEDNKNWKFNRATYSSWFMLVKKEKQAEIIIDLNRVKETFVDIQKNVERIPKNATFLFEEGRVKEFTPAQDGIAIDYDILLPLLYSAINKAENNAISVQLAVKRVEPEINTNEVNELGIKELIGKGTTNFSGSPANRRHNIRVGVSKISGLLIKPSEEFSTLKMIGEVDGEHGFKQELVIKGKETKPEFGGGLCQVSTTLFRATMNSGLPITMRRNHSYRVRYYEPPIGKDATIYDPAPDFKFINDTGHHILVIGRVEGDNITFEFWGTKDGRTQTQSEPKVGNYISPPPKKEILTTELPEGKIKCTEKAHTGATASFTYSITYPNGDLKEQVFNSVYVPWQEVCLVGVPEGTIIEDKNETTATPDNEIDPNLSDSQIPPVSSEASAI